MPLSDADVDFPTSQSLREANDAFHRSVKPGTLPVYDEDGKVVPYPARYKKSEIFKLSDYADIDRRALNAPKELLDGPVQALVDYLIQGTSTDMGKVRAIFRWITSQNTNQVMQPVKQVQSNSTMMDWLYEIKCLNYDKVFAELCRSAGIHQVTIQGHAKGIRYKPGEKIDCVNRWSAVLIDNAYYLVDLYWSSMSGSVNSKRWVLVDDNGNLSQLGKISDYTGSSNYYMYKEDWFLTNPEEMIYTHRPFEDKWQLLARPVSEKEFEDMVSLESAFFSRQLIPDNNSKKSVLYADSGEIEITFRQPNGVIYKFAYKLWLSEEDAKTALPIFKDKKLERFVKLEQDQDNFVVRCAIVFPFSGKFKIEFECSDPGAFAGYTGCPTQVCSYIIHAKQKMKNVEPLPENDRMEWGPGFDLESVGLRPIDHRSGTIQSETGEAKVVFESTKKVHTIATVHSNTRTEEDLRRNVIHYFKERQLVILARLPEVGEYALNLYASDKGPIPGPPKVCCYLIKATKPASIPREFPPIPDGRIGQTDELSSLAMRPQSHSEAYFEAPPTGETDLVFAAPLKCCFSSRLLRDDKDGLSVVERQVFVENKDSRAVFKTRFPLSGQYVLEIYGANEVQRNESLPLLFTYIIRASKAMPACPPFPKQGRISTCNGFEVVEPASLNGRLRARKHVTFRLKVPGASNVAAIGNDKNYAHLSYENGLWKGVVNTGEPTDQFMVAAKLDGSESYTTFLLFSVVADEIESAVKYLGWNKGRDTEAITIDPLQTRPSPVSYVSAMSPAGHCPPSRVSRQLSYQGHTSKAVRETPNISRRQSTAIADQAPKSEEYPLPENEPVQWGTGYNPDFF